MIKKYTILGSIFILVWTAFSPAQADQSIGFLYYFQKGVKAFNKHHDADALRLFKIAQTYASSDKELNRYLRILGERGTVFESPLTQYSNKDIEVYNYYFSEAIKASWHHDDQKAIRYFQIARIFNPKAKEPEQYLQILYQRQGTRPLSQPSGVSPPKPVFIGQADIEESMAQAPEAPAPETLQEPASISQTTVPTQQPAPASPQPAAYVATQAPHKPPQVIVLSQFPHSEQTKPQLNIELNSSLIIEAHTIERFLIVDEGFITLKTIDANHLEIDAKRIGQTFLHIWDSRGRYTFFVQVVFPKFVNTHVIGPMSTEHAVPFKVIYTNDWTNYYSGRNVKQLKRQTNDFNETLSITGETPYGFFDSLVSYSDFNAFALFDSYTVGLSQIPLEGTNNFNLRGFDAVRYLSPLTMPSTHLRGVFTDVDLWDNMVGLSFGEGLEQIPIGFINQGQKQFTHTTIDAFKLTLFPLNDNDRYSFNFATDYGPDRPGFLSNHVYSAQAQHKFTKFLTFNAEHGTDTQHDASLASLTWKDTNFSTAFNFRNINQHYTTISYLPAYQGETGVSWATEGSFKNFQENTFIEAYKDVLDQRSNSSNELNYDGNANVRIDMGPDSWSETNFNFLDTQAELSPQQNVQVNQRFSRRFKVWNSLNATAFAGIGSQYGHAKESKIADYTRQDLVLGFQVPLTTRISSFASYEYDWLRQPHNGGNSYPNIVNAGLQYQRQFTSHVSINGQISYRDELGVAANSSFLAGEESVILSGSLNYDPTPDVSIFADTNVSRVISHTGNAPYDDFGFHIGMRISLGGTMFWDPAGTVSGIVFKDKKSLGRFVSGDEGIPGVKVKVGDQEVRTDKEGRYHIKIKAKAVDVVPVLDTLPGGLIFSTPQSLHVPIIQGRITKADFGLTSQTGIYGLVFVSVNGSGVPGERDKFMGKVGVILDGKVTVKSDVHGAFYFRHVTPGPHTISVDINSIALDMVPMVKLVNKIYVTEGTNYTFNVPLQMKKAQEQE